MDVKKMAERWSSVKKALKKEDKGVADKLVAMIKKHSNEVFYNFSDPLEAAVFSALLEMQKQIDEMRVNCNGMDSGLLYWQKNSDVGKKEGKSEKD